MNEALNKYRDNYFDKGNVPNTEFEKFLLSIASQEEDKDIILDVMFDYIESMIRARQWSNIDLFLARIKLEEASLTFLIGVLSITAHIHKEKKAYRNEVFFPKIKSMLESRDIDPETLLIGLN